MIVIEETIEIARPPAAAFRYLGDGFFEMLRHANPMIVELEKTSPGPVAKGTTGREVQLIQKKRRARTFRIGEFERDRVIEVRGTGGDAIEKHYLGRYTLTPTASGGTRLTQRFELEWDDTMFRVAPWLVKFFIRRSIRDAQQRSKSAIEASA